MGRNLRVNEAQPQGERPAGERLLASIALKPYCSTPSLPSRPAEALCHLSPSPPHGYLSPRPPPHTHSMFS